MRSSFLISLCLVCGFAQAQSEPFALALVPPNEMEHRLQVLQVDGNVLQVKGAAFTVTPSTQIWLEKNHQWIAANGLNAIPAGASVSILATESKQLKVVRVYEGGPNKAEESLLRLNRTKPARTTQVETTIQVVPKPRP